MFLFFFCSIFFQDENAMPYVSAARDPLDPKTVNGFKIMNMAKLYFQEPFRNETKFHDYDTTVVMTA